MDDYIRREDAKNAVLGLTMYKGAVPVDSVLFNINKVKSADVRPTVRGRWIWDDLGYHCSECFYNPVGSDEIFFGEYKFCPHCGAEMEGEEEQ